MVVHVNDRIDGCDNYHELISPRSTRAEDDDEEEEEECPSVATKESDKIDHPQHLSPQLAPPMWVGGQVGRLQLSLCCCGD